MLNTEFRPPAGRFDPVAILGRQSASRVPQLVPIRYARMLESPSAFYRGAVAVMAADLAPIATSGLTVQLCGDAHLANFGLFASPERRLVFDVNDFDETHPGPWEWDVWRLAASVEITGRDNGFGGKARRKAVRAMARGYGRAMADFARTDLLTVWYAHADARDVKKLRKAKVARTLDKAHSRTNLRAFKKLTELDEQGRRRIAADPPLLVPARDFETVAESCRLADGIRILLEHYRDTLPVDVRLLFDRFELTDTARKVVGVGSVGTRCWIAMLRERSTGEPLFLQVKQAQKSVLVEYGGVPAARPVGEGERVVQGQRLMQAVSDIFLGWQNRVDFNGENCDFYVRQLANWKGAVELENLDPQGLARYASLCAWTLARAHARSGDRAAIAAELVDEQALIEAVTTFAGQYADQNERDFEAFARARTHGLIEVAE